MFLPSNLSELNQTHLDQLVAAGATEGSHLDFKRELPTNWDQEAKKRFMADVTAFANAGGGDLVFGVEEDANAQAAAVVPQEFNSVDLEVRRVQDFILELAEPRLPGVQVQAVPVSDGARSGHAVVIRVPESWAGPHRSKVNLHFYVREGLRNRQLDIPEIRGLFLRSENQAQRMRDFRAARLAQVVTGQTPVKLSDRPKLVVHAIPTQAALGQVFIDPVQYTKGRRTLPVLGTLPVSPVTLNLDGAFGPIVSPGNQAPGYTQQFREGYFEAVWELAPFGDVTKPVLPGSAYESYVNQFLGNVRGEAAASNVAQQLAVFVSLIGANEAVLAGPSGMGRGWGYSVKGFDRKDILLPDVLIQPDESIGHGMRPAYDLMCQAAGYEGSPNYGADGEWQAGQ
jgi:hypothetical protein